VPAILLREDPTAYRPRKIFADYETATTFWEWKKDLTAMRAVREALVLAIHKIVETKGKTFCLVLVDPGISTIKLEKEVGYLKTALRSKIAERLELAIIRNHRLERRPRNIPDPELLAVQIIIEEEVGSRFPLPRADRQSEVLRVLLNQWINGTGPITLSSLAEMAGCNYRTVNTAIKKLGSAVKRESDRRVSLKYFPTEPWVRYIANAQKARGSIYYTDRSGQSRSAQSLIRRLEKLHRSDIAIGGVPAAEHYFPALDISSPPRLDLCVHAPENEFDPGLVDRLDPGLSRIDHPEEKVYLAVHFLRRKESFFSQGSTGIPWADPIECLTDLYDARLSEQASAFQAYLSELGKNENAVSEY